METKETETKLKPALHVAKQLLKKSFPGLILGSIFLAITATAQTTAIEGVVRGPDSKALKGADVRIESKGGSKLLKTVKTDANGRYVSDGLPAGIYRVTLVVNGAVKSSIKNTKTKADGPTQLNFDLKPVPAAKAAAKGGKHMVWVPASTGSHVGGRWVEVDDSGNAEPGALNVKRASAQELERAARSADAPGHP